MKSESKDDALRWMRKAFVTCRSNPKLSHGELLTQAGLVFLEEHPELRPSDGRLIDAAMRHASNEPLAGPLVEAFWYLVSVGYIIPQPSGRNAGDFNWISITKLGCEWAEGSEPSPEDQQGFLMALKGQITQLDPVVEQYVQEAVMAYGRSMFFASAVMIGAASEKTIYLLMDALVNSVEDPNHNITILKSINGRKMPSMFKCLHENLTRAKKCMPWHVHEGADTHLLSLQESIRVQRNDAVHPQAGKVTPQTVRLTLASFPGACKKAHDLIQWFQTNHF